MLWQLLIYLGLGNTCSLKIQNLYFKGERQRFYTSKAFSFDKKNARNKKKNV